MLLKDTNDIYGTLYMNVKRENEAAKEIKEANNKIVDLFNEFMDNPENYEDIVVMQQNMDIVAIEAELAKIEKKLSTRTNGIINQVVDQAYRRGIETAQQMIDRIDNVPPKSPRVSSKDQQIIRMIKNTDFSLINTLTQQHVVNAKHILVNGLNNSLSQQQIIQQIRQMAGNTEYQARRIVRTEITRTSNIAAKKRFQSRGLKYWQWNTAQDERVCPVCGPLHGKVQEIGKSFNIYLTGQGQRQNKGKILMQPPAHPFCRCGVSPAFRKIKKSVSKPLKVKQPKPDLIGFKQKEKKEFNDKVKVVPLQVRKNVSLLTGKKPIIKTAGRIVEDPEVKTLVSDEILNKYRDVTGMYLIKAKRVFVDKNSSIDELLHEVGHSIYNEYLFYRPHTKNKWTALHDKLKNSGLLLSARSAVDSEEHFSDAFRFYLNKPLLLQNKLPEVYKFFKDNIFFGNEFNSIITLEDDNHET